MRTELNGAGEHGWQRYMVVLLVLCLIQYTGIWIYPPNTFASLVALTAEKRFSVPFQYGLWCLLVFTLFRLVLRDGMTPFAQALRGFLPFLLVGLVASVFGYAPIPSVRLLILWSAMACAAVAIGISLPQKSAERVLLWTMLSILVLCIVYALALPGLGTMPYGSTTVWRGLFGNKNQLGWFASLVLVMAVMLRNAGANRLPNALALAAVVCLLLSGSKGALATSVVALTYMFLLRWLRPKVTPGFGIGVVLTLMVIGGVFFALAYLPLLELLGRDATLTGRTNIWSAYFSAMVSNPWLGEGPGSFTGLSPMTAVLANQLDNFGAIVTPHSSYLGIFGDAGLFGLVIFIGMMVHMSLVEPMLRPSRMYLLSGGLCFLIAAGGLVETHDIYTPGPGWFLLILARTLALQQRGVGAAAGADTARAVPSRSTYTRALPLRSH